MLYGKLAKLDRYNKKKVNELALEYYYKVFSDANNIGATKTLLANSRGTNDFIEFINKLISNENTVGGEWSREKDYLVNVGVNKDRFSYSSR